ncbi:MAG: N-acetylglucosamine-6-phosphate deacetylase [Hydrogenibacillus sp.]|nr:N-acetylglucosamine-6-phosphate deacetylase [Hydrogenibacillus sp.]
MWEIRDVDVVLPDEVLSPGFIRMGDDGRIRAVGTLDPGRGPASHQAAGAGEEGGAPPVDRTRDVPDAGQTISGAALYAAYRRAGGADVDARAEALASGRTVIAVPGMIDMHIHGAAGADVMDATPEALSQIARTLLAEGTTGFLATTISAPKEQLLRALRNIAAYKRMRAQKSGTSDVESDATLGTPEAEILGIHLEGPYLSPARAGAQPREALRPPETAEFQALQAAADGLIRLVTTAPELPGALEWIAELAAHGVIVSLGHTDADYETARAAADRGARHVTHVFNAMRGLHHREPGMLGAALVDDRLTVELIADGVHVHPALYRLVHRAKGRDRLLLITDAMRAKRMPDGCYELGGQPVTVRCGRATLADGTLAGSVLTMNEGLKRLVQAGIPLVDAVRFASTNPARALGLDGHLGALLPGYRADVVLLAPDFQVLAVFRRGRPAYAAPGVEEALRMRGATTRPPGR